jgi:putative oxidoreductase
MVPAMEYMPHLSDFNLALLLLRVVVGPTFAFHGYAKIFRGGRLTGTARWFDSIGMRPGEIHARLAATGELLTGVCLLLGFMTPFAGLGLVGLMAVAFWTVHRGNGLLVVANGWEYNLVLATIGVTVATLGPGRWSLDHALGIHVHGYPGLLISLGGGILLAALVVGSSFQPPVAEAESTGAAVPEAESADVPVAPELSDVELLPEAVEAPAVPVETVDPEEVKAEEPTVPDSPVAPKASTRGKGKVKADAVASPLKDVNLDSLAAEADALVAKAKAARTSGDEASETEIETEPAEPAMVEIDAVVTESETSVQRSTQTKPRSSKSRSARGQGSRASGGAPRQ